MYRMHTRAGGQISGARAAEAALHHHLLGARPAGPHRASPRLHGSEIGRVAKVAARSVSGSRVCGR